MKQFITTSMILIWASTCIHAESMEEKNIALKVGTLGLGIDISTAINSQASLRVNLNGATINRDERVDDIDYTGDLKLLTLGVLVDYYPLDENTFRFTAGAYYNKNQFSLQAQPALSEAITIGDVSYTGSEVGQLDASVAFNKVAPYVGIGFGNKPSTTQSWGFTLDIGAMYQGTAVATAQATVNEGLPEELKTQIHNDVERERQKIEEDMGSYTWYPVVMIGVNYTF